MRRLIHYFFCILVSSAVFAVCVNSHVYAKSSAELYLGKVVSMADSTVEIITNISTDKQLNGYDVEVSFDHELILDSYQAENSCDGQIQVAQTRKDTVTILCLLTPGRVFTGNDSVNLTFVAPENSETVLFSVVKADMTDDDGVSTRDLTVDFKPSNVQFEAPLSVNHDFSTPILVIAGIIVLLAGGSYIYRFTKQRAPTQMRMFDFIGVLSLTFAIAATVLVVGSDNFDLREKAATPEVGITAENGNLKLQDRPLKEEWIQCKKDSDCINVSTGCCLCASSKLAINRKYLEEFNIQYDCNDNIRCTQVYCEPSVSYCYNNFCTLAEAGTKKCSNSNLDPDLNSDGKVSISDYNIFLVRYLDYRFSGKFDAIADLNCDGILSLKDYNTFVLNYLKLRKR